MAARNQNPVSRSDSSKGASLREREGETKKKKKKKNSFINTHIIESEIAGLLTNKTFNTLNIDVVQLDH